MLTLEHIEVTGRDSPDYGIFVEPTGGAGDDAVLVGVMSLFGIVGDAEQDGEHEYNFAFDLEPAVEQLSAIDEWDPTTVTLSFRPLNDRWIATQRGANALADITIGSIEHLGAVTATLTLVRRRVGLFHPSGSRWHWRRSQPRRG